jgi:LytR cell envelope-related transcriptional attenuator
MSFARVRALVVVGVLAVAAVVFVIVALVKDSQGTPVGGGCPAGAPAADLTLPRDPAEVTVKVFNGTSTGGLAESVTSEFKNRLFKTEKPAENKTKFKGVADIRYGPDAVGKAQLLRAYFLNQSKMEYNAKRKGSTIDIVVGNQFRQLATTTEVNQSLVEIGEPTVPPGACAKVVKKDDGKS